MTAFFMDEKRTGFDSLEEAMTWVDQRARCFGMKGHEAEAKGFAQIFQV